MHAIEMRQFLITFIVAHNITSVIIKHNSYKHWSVYVSWFVLTEPGGRSQCSVVQWDIEKRDDHVLFC